MKTAIENKVEERVKEIYEEMIKLAGSSEGTEFERRRAAAGLIDELKISQRMLTYARPVPINGNLSSYGDPSAAVAAWLSSRGKPATIDEILDGVFAGGYMGGDRANHQLSVRLSVMNRLTGTGKVDVNLGLKGDIKGLIGLRDWDDSLFQP